MKYIDAEKLKAEIERRRLQNRYMDTDGYEQELFEIIDSLQQEQPEVDLEKEFRRFIKKEKEGEPDGSLPFYGDYGIYRIARHFYELGKKQ